MNTTESTQNIEAAILRQKANLEWIRQQATECRRQAVELSLQGWPGDANHYRRQAVKLNHIIKKIESWLKAQPQVS